MPREKHVPERACVVCRTRRAKRDLTRVVRTPEGEVVIDFSGRANGRGAYLCSDPAHWVDAVERGKLKHALNVAISAEARQALLEHAEMLRRESAAYIDKNSNTGVIAASGN
ncbi:MAG: YlxR family protein [Dehalococcoidia bacterium]